MHKRKKIYVRFQLYMAVCHIFCKLSNFITPDFRQPDKTDIPWNLIFQVNNFKDFIENDLSDLRKYKHRIYKIRLLRHQNAEKINKYKISVIISLNGGVQ